MKVALLTLPFALLATAEIDGLKNQNSAAGIRAADAGNLLIPRQNVINPSVRGVRARNPIPRRPVVGIQPFPRPIPRWKPKPVPRRPPIIRHPIRPRRPIRRF